MSTALHGRRILRATGIVAVTGVALALAACAPTDGGGDADFGTFDYLAPNENSIIRDELTSLSEDQCEAENEAMPFTVETLPQSDVNQRVTLLATQDALPEMFIAPTAGLRPGGELGEDDITLNLEETLADLGVLDDILPAAISTVKNVYGDRFVSLPYQFNIEGFWYNIALFEELGIDEPETWDDWLDAVETIEESGTQPFIVSGAQSWTILRYVGNHIFRSLGPDAMRDIASGDAKLTDPEYLESIEAIGELQQYMPQGVSTLDLPTAVSQLLTGDAAMMYNGSWILADINNEELNQLGDEAFGFFGFPSVDGGEGSQDQLAANAGAATSFSTNLYNDGVGAWLSCIAENYGSSVMNNQGVISGFALNQEIDEVPPLTAEVQEVIAETSDTVLWFEALFGQRGAATAGENAVPLITGSISAQQFAELVQAAIDEDLAAQ